MAQVLKNIVSFTGLAVGVPAALPHGLILNGLGAVKPKTCSPNGGGFTVTADTVNVTVTRLSTGAASVDILCEYWHSLEDSQPQPNGIATTLFPFIVGGGGVGGGGAIQSLAAGTTLATGPLISFVNGGNITFGINGNTITASVQTAGGTATGVGIIAGTTSAATGAVSFADSNNISFGMNASTVTASFSASIQPNPAISAAGASASNGTIVWSNSNNVSFGMAGSTITATVSVAAGASATGNFGALSAAGGAITSGTALFSNGSGVSFGIAGQTLTASVAAGATATGNLGGVAAAGGTITSGTVSFANSNGISFGVNGQTVTASFSGGGAETPFGISAGTQSVSTGTVIFSNDPSFNVTFGMSGSRTISAQAGIAIAGGGATNGNFQTIVFNTGNGVTFGVNNQSISARVATVSATGAESARVLAQTANILLSVNSGNISIMAPANALSEGILISAAQRVSVLAGDRIDVAAGVELNLDGPVINVDGPTLALGQGTGTIGVFGVAGTNRRTITGNSTNASGLLLQLIPVLASLGWISNGVT